MASTFFGLSISYKGLQAAQTSITTTAHNLSNINTDGYTKQSVLLQASDALRTYSTYGTIGSGVNVVEIKQTRDSYYDEKYRNNCANYGQYEAKNNYMTQVEDYLNEFLLSGFSKEYGNFFDAVNQLTITPADTSAKNQLINNAKSMTDYFNTLANNLRNVQADANNEVKDTVEHINTLAQNITALNKQINQIEACYGDANDLRDQRNALVDELSKAVNITVSETEIQNGLTSFQITINGQSLVNDYSYRTLEVVARGEVRNTSDADGLYDIKWNDGSDFNIYSDSLGGQLKALIDIRDGCNGEIESYAKNDDGTYKTDIDGNIVTETNAQAGENINYKGVPYYQVQLNTFIQTFAQAVNSIFESGYVSDADTTDAKNKGIYFDDIIHPSVVQFIYATEPTISKLFKHIEWRSQLINGLMNNEDNIRYLYNKTIDWLMFHTDVQCTGLMPMSVSPIWWDNETLKYKAGRYLWNRIEDFVENDHGQWNPNPNLINFMDKDAIETLIELSAKYQKPWYDIAKFHNAWTYITMIYENKFFSQEADDYVDDITKYPDATQLDLRLTNIEVMIDKDTRL